MQTAAWIMTAFGGVLVAAIVFLGKRRGDARAKILDDAFQTGVLVAMGLGFVLPWRPARAAALTVAWVILARRFWVLMRARRRGRPPDAAPR